MFGHRMLRVALAPLRRVLPRTFASGHWTARTISRMASASTWDGSGTQEDLMYRDEVVLVVRAPPRFFGRHQPTPFQENVSRGDCDASCLSRVNPHLRSV